MGCNKHLSKGTIYFFLCTLEKHCSWKDSNGSLNGL